MPPWTVEDLQFLITHHARVTNKGMHDLLQGRHSLSSIRSQACRLELRKSQRIRSLMGKANNRFAKKEGAAIASG